LVNPLGIFKFDENGEMYAAALHAGVTPDEARATFGWPIKVQSNHEVLPAPNENELKVIREELAHAKERFYLLPEG
jgi:glutaconate CoA-transferase subunit B